jgi:hypothetical protein
MATVHDAAYPNAPVFTLGAFSFERPADVSSTSPQSAVYGADVRLMVFGSYFLDTPGLSCLLGSGSPGGAREAVPAQWMSDTLVVCAVPAAAVIRNMLTDVNTTAAAGTAHLEIAPSRVPLYVSNNGLDVSAHHVNVSVKAAVENVAVSPLVGYASGGTSVSVTFTNTFPGPIICRFGPAPAVTAYRIDGANYFCVSPAQAAGTVVLTVTDDSDAAMYRTNFTYADLPRLLSVSPSTALQSGVPTTVTFMGSAIAPATVGRFRRVVGGATDGNCTVISSTTMTCKTIPPAADTDLFFDVSVNGKDWRNGAMVFQVFQSAVVVEVGPVVATASGGSVIDLYAVHLVSSAFPLMCHFAFTSPTSGPDTVLVPVSARSDTNGYCTTPPLPLNGDAPPTFAVVQNNQSIYGPVRLTLRPDPQLNAVTPATVLGGVLSQVLLTFALPLHPLLRLRCFLAGGGAHPVVLLNVTAGYCSVYPLTAGNFTLIVAETRDAVTARNTMPLAAVARPTDVVLNATAVAAFPASPVAATSPSCAVPAGAYCASDDASVVTASADACGVVCVVQPLMGRTTIVFDVCFTTPCALPLFTQTVDVIAAMTVVALRPAAATVLGGAIVTVVGSGFVNDATLMCVFGTATSPALVLSPSRLQCAAPPALPGTVPLQLMRRGVVVSTSLAAFDHFFRSQYDPCSRAPP